LALALAYAASAQAAVTIDVTQVGSNVDFTATGSLNLTDATPDYPSNYGLGVIPGGDNWYIAFGDGRTVSTYLMSSAVRPFGTSTSYFSSPSSDSGTNFFIWGDNGESAKIGIDSNYVSGGAISSVMEFTSLTLADMGLAPGAYVYAIPNDTITVVVGETPVPEPASLGLIGVGVAAMGFLRRRRG